MYVSTTRYRRWFWPQWKDELQPLKDVSQKRKDKGIGKCPFILL